MVSADQLSVDMTCLVVPLGPSGSLLEYIPCFVGRFPLGEVGHKVGSLEATGLELHSQLVV